MEIDYNQTSPEYYQEKVKELHAKCRAELQITVQDLELLIEFCTPEFSDFFTKRFELLKKFCAQEFFLDEIIRFLNMFYSWNKKAMIEKLDEMYQFITEASKIPQKIANEKRYRYSGIESQKIVFLRIENGYYKQNPILIGGFNELKDFKVVYGKYFLFKELLEQKLNIKPEKQNEITGFVSNITGFQSNLNDEQIETLYNQMQGNYFEATPANFKAIFISKPLPPDCSIKWIDTGKTRHEPNKQTIFEFLYLLKDYGHLDRSIFNVSPADKNNLYRKLETLFPDIKNFSASNPQQAQNRTPRKKELKTIILTL